jgi:lipoprotein-anchoring transpeptidase ErfK/SrfK
MRLRWVVLVALGLGCGGKKDTPPAPPAAEKPTNAPVAGSEEPAPIEVPAFPEGTRSLELVRTVSVRLEPGEDARRIGTIAVDTRVRWTETAAGKGCKKPWVQIVPRGWVCSDYMKPSKRAPHGREVPMLDRGELVPGIYGKVTAANQVTYQLQKPEPPKKGKSSKKKEQNGPVTSTAQVDVAPEGPQPKMVEGPPIVGSVTVRQYDEITVGGKQYWKVSKKDNEYVLRSAISQHKPSLYNGARFGDDTSLAAPIAFVYPRATGYKSAYTMRAANGGGIARSLPARTPIAILETASDKKGTPTAYRIGVPSTAPGPGPGSPPIVPGSEWIRANDVRIFAAAAPPANLAKGERWMDIDLDTQILVAFEGDLAVYATMVSSGKKETPTTTGIYRMWVKESEADMKNLKSEDPYSVATVPWTQFFYPDEDLAIHTAYWHDAFGQVKSHGCVNLAPKDARWLYFWSDPQVPAGWTMAAGVVEAPGSIVRVRSKADPNPALKGYARQVDEVRRQNSPG